jgi:putative transposase
MFLPFRKEPLVKAYQIQDRADIPRLDSAALAQALQKDEQLLLPLLDVVVSTTAAVDEIVDVAGRATLEAILELSARQLAGERHPGKAAGPLQRHGRQGGIVHLSNRKVRLSKPRRRRKATAEAPATEEAVPAYEALRRPGPLAQRVGALLLKGLSTRRYREVLPDVAEEVGVSKSAVSRQMIEASEQQLQELHERRFDEVELLIIYLDGIQCGAHHVLVAVGVDLQGHKHALGLREGSSENAVIATELLQDLVARGVKPDQRRLFVSDGSKALRVAVDQVFGARNPVQRCRNHKRRNVLGHLPKEQHEQVRLTLQAAFRLEAKEGMAKIEQLARWLERDHPSAAGRLREGLAELFTINRLGLPKELRRCLATTNLLDATHSGMREKMGRVTRWRDGAMAMRWTAASLLATEKSYRRIMGHRQLWMLKAVLKEDAPRSQEPLAASMPAA